MRRVLFLGYHRSRTCLIEAIEANGWSVEQTADRVSDLSGADLVVSFGYRHILPASVLATAGRPALNLHIGFLPWNRGAHPVYWALTEGTPLGVTIHEMDAGVDTGPIVVQRRVSLPSTDRTFAQAYETVFAAMERLFLDHMAALLAGAYIPTPQAGRGSHRRVRELPEGACWQVIIPSPPAHPLRGAVGL